MRTGGTTNKPSKSLTMRVLFFTNPIGVPNCVPSCGFLRKSSFSVTRNLNESLPFPPLTTQILLIYLFSPRVDIISFTPMHLIKTLKPPGKQVIIFKGGWEKGRLLK